MPSGELKSKIVPPDDIHDALRRDTRAPSMEPMPLLYDERLTLLNEDSGPTKQGMRNALRDALQLGEHVVALYRVGAHIWVEALLTDRALLLVQGPFRPKVTRIPFPIAATRPPSGLDVHVLTPLGHKTLWGSRQDPGGATLRKVTVPSTSHNDHPTTPPGQPTQPGRDSLSSPDGRVVAPASANGSVATDRQVASEGQPGPTPTGWLQGRRAAGHRPRKPRPAQVWMQAIGPEPHPMMWDMADYCVKCGRPLTNLNSRVARVGTTCITIYGSQHRLIPNRAHAAWLTVKSRAEVDYIDRKHRAEADYARATATYDAALDEWLRVRTGGGQPRWIHRL